MYKLIDKIKDKFFLAQSDINLLSIQVKLYFYNNTQVILNFNSLLKAREQQNLPAKFKTTKNFIKRPKLFFRIYLSNLKFYKRAFNNLSFTKHFYLRFKFCKGDKFLF